MLRRACSARRTDPPSLAREGDDDLVVACLAANTSETVGQDAAAEVRGDLAYQVIGPRPRPAIEPALDEQLPAAFARGMGVPIEKVRFR